ncbi:MAG: ribonuclease P protein component [Candidatus Brocadiia bacterium]|nr:MAG: ribonuclease P protein component [Candidatus Brocadiia bacterium]
MIIGVTLKRLTLGKNKRLLSNSQFEDVLARKLRFSNSLLTLYMAENQCGYPRLGVSVGKAHGNSVVRNRLKRLLREAFRLSQEQLPESYDYLLMVSAKWSAKSEDISKDVKLLKAGTIEKSFMQLVKKAGSEIG